jgi:hypothetical protein
MEDIAEPVGAPRPVGRRRKLVEREDAESQIDLEVPEPDAARPSKVREVLRRVGVPLEGARVED